MRANAALWPDAVATASSEFSSAFGAAKVQDGFTRTSSDWASKGEQNPWIELRWDEPVRADRIVLYDRTSVDDANGGTLTFSDGSSVEVTGLPTDGRAREVTFPMREFTSLRFQVAGGSGPNVGLLELEVFAAPRPQRPARIDVRRSGAEATVTWTPPAFDGGAPVTGYVVRTYRDGAVVAEAEAGADAREAVVPAREGDVFTVAARNLAGTGPERGIDTTQQQDGRISRMRMRRIGWRRRCRRPWR